MATLQLMKDTPCMASGWLGPLRRKFAAQRRDWRSPALPGSLSSPTGCLKQLPPQAVDSLVLYRESVLCML